MQKRELKFRYVLERNSELKLFAISLADCEIESSTFERFRQLTVYEGWSIIDILQYTGQKDKNGKGGYHGDIWTDGLSKFKIDWLEKKCVFALVGITISREYSLADLPDGEIIGNISENPELIKAVK